MRKGLEDLISEAAEKKIDITECTEQIIILDEITYESLTTINLFVNQKLSHSWIRYDHPDESQLDEYHKSQQKNCRNLMQFWHSFIDILNKIHKFLQVVIGKNDEVMGCCPPNVGGRGHYLREMWRLLFLSKSNLSIFLDY